MSKLSDLAKASLNAGIVVAKNAVVAAAITALPILGFPVIKQTFNWLVNWVVGKITPHLEVWLADTVIDIEVKAEARAYARAKDELQAVLAKHVRSQKEIEDASKEFDDRLADLVVIRR